MTRPVLAALVGMLFTTACGASGPQEAVVPEADAPIARVWRSRCGICHVRVEPGTRDHDTLVDALARHKSRVRLSDAQWEAMQRFLEAKPAETKPVDTKPADTTPAGG